MSHLLAVQTVTPHWASYRWVCTANSQLLLGSAVVRRQTAAQYDLLSRAIDTNHYASEHRVNRYNEIRQDQVMCFRCGDVVTKCSAVPRANTRFVDRSTLDWTEV